MVSDIMVLLARYFTLTQLSWEPWVSIDLALL